MKDLLATNPYPNRDPADVQKENDLLRHNLETAATTFSGFKNQAKAVVGTAQRTIFNKLENSPMLFSLAGLRFLDGPPHTPNT